ncbi:MAG: hypothetical protein J7K22_01115 [Nanoarchaeota archaeon]|nr:hypothetical protein [Nanoarchaeota archaeon]
MELEEILDTMYKSNPNWEPWKYSHEELGLDEEDYKNLLQAWIKNLLRDGKVSYLHKSDLLALIRELEFVNEKQPLIDLLRKYVNVNLSLFMDIYVAMNNIDLKKELERSVGPNTTLGLLYTAKTCWYPLEAADMYASYILITKDIKVLKDIDDDVIKERTIKTLINNGVTLDGEKFLEIADTIDDVDMYISDKAIELVQEVYDKYIKDFVSFAEVFKRICNNNTLLFFEDYIVNKAKQVVGENMCLTETIVSTIEKFDEPHAEELINILFRINSAFAYEVASIYHLLKGNDKSHLRKGIKYYKKAVKEGLKDLRGIQDALESFADKNPSLKNEALRKAYSIYAKYKDKYGFYVKNPNLN